MISRHAVLVMFWCVLGAHAQAQGITSDTVQSLPAFLDTAVPAMMQERQVLGTSVAVVHQGKVVYLRGYGHPWLDTDKPVDPATTAFRIGSVSKLFTAIAALQLVDAGKLDLHRNIGEYLPDLPLQYPTTTHQLLTHTAGFDERFAGAYTESAPIPSLSDHLRRDPPRQVIRPGIAYSYSNYNFAVAGAVIETLAEQRFEQYLAERVFAPLRMTSTTAYQPPPAPIDAGLARGYRWVGDHQQLLPARLTFASASGGVTSSAGDMARLLVTLLSDGGSDGSRILSPSSTEILIASQYTPHARITGAAYGSMHWRTHGRDLLFKDGTLGDQIGVVVLDPAERLGIFLASNALPGIEPILEPLLTHLFGPAVPAAAPVARPSRPASAFAGTYRDFHHTRSDLSRLRALMPMIQTRVIAGSDGSIQWRGRRWVEVEPLLFQSADGRDHIVFSTDGGGAVTVLHAWGGSYERIGVFEQAPFHLGVFLSCVLAFVAYPALRIRRLRHAAGEAGARRIARRSGTTLAVINLIFVVGLAVLFMELGASVPLPVLTVLWLSLPLVGLPLTAATAFLALAAWRGGWWTLGERVAYTALAAAAVAFMLFLGYWRLLGFQY